MSGAPIIPFINNPYMIGLHRGEIRNPRNHSVKDGIRWTRRKLIEISIFMREMGVEATFKLD